MKKIFFTFAVMMLSMSAYAGPPSILGGKALEQPTANFVSVGWPSLSYEWWHAGHPDWALGAELVYGDWSGKYSDVDIGIAFNVPFRWEFHKEGNADVAFLLKPGVLFGDKDDTFVFAFRPEIGLPVTISLNDRANLITGVSVPLTIVKVEHVDTYVVIPIMPRIGVEFAADRNFVPTMLLELGPTIAAGNGDTEVGLGIRASVGALFF